MLLHIISKKNVSIIFKYNRNNIEGKIKDQFKTLGLLPQINSFQFKYLALENEENDLTQDLQKISNRFKGKTFSSFIKPEVIIYGDKARIRFSKPSLSSQVTPVQKNISSPVNTILNRKIKVLVVDDSKTIRTIISRLINSSENLEVVAQAENPLQVEKLIQKHQPDVMTLDINMPEMTGVELLEQLLPKQFIPTVVVSSLNISEGTQVIKAMEIGAVDYLQKPSLEKTEEFKNDLLKKLKFASTQKKRQKTTRSNFRKTKWPL